MFGGAAFLAGLMPGRAAIVLGTFVLILGTALGLGLGWKVNGDRWEAKYTKAELRHTHELTLQAEAALTALAAWQAAIDTARNEVTHAKQTIGQLQAQLSATNRRLADAVTGNDRLRDQLATYAAGRGDAGSAACPDRAAALAAYAADVAEAAGRVGGRALAVAETAALAASERDTYAAEVIACVSAWPKASGITGPSDAGEQ